MAESDITMGRLARLERDMSDLKGSVGQIVEVLVDQSARIDALGQSLGQRLDGLGDRLDRLIAVTTQERTFGIERLGDIERRLTRLEERTRE